MKINRQALDRILAEQRRSISDLRGSVFGAATIARIRKGDNVTTRTATRLAEALYVPLERLTVAEGVVVDRAKLKVETAARGLTDRQILKIAGVSAFDLLAINTKRWLLSLTRQ